MNPIQRAILVVFCLVFAAASAFATDLTFTASSGDRAASIEFSMVGGQLWITLRNMSEADALYPTDMLGGAFFDVAENPVLTPDWAKLDTEACFLYPTNPGCSSPVNRNVGGEWAYRMYSTGSPIIQHYGLGAVGYGFFGPSDRFDTSQNIAGDMAIDGGDFSLAPMGDNPTTAIGGLINNRPYIRYGAQFAFYVPAGFNPAASISNVRFQWGTDFSEPWEPIAEPATVALIGGGLIALGLLRRRFAR